MENNHNRGIMAMILPIFLTAQNKIGFVQSDRIRAE
ncbi:MAG: hypothetical protein Ct9H300mP29_4460 [Candidatus Neomarinimicrobiota bacterium]|nr:MAG: hypothetical protein Ct9H300mP29_4460 [Candidatus Neomarinimicrobiota bacterium]